MPVRRTALALRPFRPVRGPGSVAILLALALASAACERSQRGDGAIEAAHPEDAARAASAPRPVDAARLADPAPGEWPSHGRSYLEQRYSPLSQIDTTNVGRLGLAWSFDLGSDRGVEATPLVADGTLYVGCDDGRLYALAGSPAGEVPDAGVDDAGAARAEPTDAGAALAEPTDAGASQSPPPDTANEP